MGVEMIMTYNMAGIVTPVKWFRGLKRSMTPQRAGRFWFVTSACFSENPGESELFDESR
jgi:hypothetical protein